MIEQVFHMFGPAAPLFSKVLLHSLWQGSLVALFLAVALRVLKHQSAQMRYVASCLSLLVMLGMSVATGLYTGTTNGAPYNASAADRLAEIDGSAESRVTPALAVEPGSTQSAAPSGGFTLRSVQRFAFPVWLTGVFLLSLYHLLGWRQALRLTRREIGPVSEAWKIRFHGLCGTMGLSRAVELLASSAARVPCVIGWIKPVVLVPLSSFSGLDEEELEMIILHELAHVRRHDILVAYLQTAVEILFFFNPAVWWISRKIKLEREHCCDDLVVELSGDRIRYARALASLAQSRLARTRLVAAADSTPLLARVRRILGVPSEQGRPSRGSIGGVLLLAALLTLSIGAFSGTTYSDTRPETFLETSEPVEPERGDIRGDWEIEYQARQYYIRIRFGRNWSTGFSVDAAELLRDADPAGSSFKLQRDAGTFYLKGEFEREGDELWGEGECFFRANPEYTASMEELGYRLDDRDDLLTLAVHDVTLAYVRGLDSLGYDDLSLQELLRARIHGVTPELILELEELGYRNLRLNTLVKMQVHRVESTFIKDLGRLGYKDLSPETLVKMRVHDVSPEYIEELAELGYNGLRSEELVKMQIHYVEPDFIRDLAELGYGDLSENRLVEFRIHGVAPRFVEDLAELGYKDLEPSRLVEFRIHGVTPDFIEDLAEFGYKDLKPSRLVEFRIHNVSSGYIRDLAELGYRDITPSRLVEMKIHGVTPSYIKKLQRRGYSDLSTGELVEFRIHGR